MEDKGGNSQVSQMACSQQGRRKALMANLLQFAHRSLIGMSSGERELVQTTLETGALTAEREWGRQT